jgi:hypothetical protein
MERNFYKIEYWGHNYGRTNTGYINLERTKLPNDLKIAVRFFLDLLIEEEEKDLKDVDLSKMVESGDRIKIEYYKWVNEKLEAELELKRQEWSKKLDEVINRYSKERAEQKDEIRSLKSIIEKQEEELKLLKKDLLPQEEKIGNRFELLEMD